MELVKFKSWPEVLAYARTGGPLYYQAPMNLRPTMLRPGSGTPYSYEAKARSIRIWPPGSTGRGRSRTADPFTADAGHLERFSRPDEGAASGGAMHERGKGRVRSDDTPPEEIGTLGDVHFAEHGGGLIYCRRETGQTDIYGDCFLEYVEPPTDDVEFDSPDARWTVYRVELDPEIPNWADLKAVAQTTDTTEEGLKKGFTNTDPIARARAYEDVAGYYGWNNFDYYPLQLTGAEMNERYDVDLDIYGAVHTALEEMVQKMVDENAAQGWSQVGDELMIDLDREGYNDQEIYSIAEFGDAVAVNAEVLVDPGFERELGLGPAPASGRGGVNPHTWSEVGSGALERWLKKNGYEETDKGGSVPSVEGYAYAPHVIDAVAHDMDLPKDFVEKAAKELDWWQEEIPGSTDGHASVWAKRKEGEEGEPLEEARRRRPRASARRRR